MKEISHNTPPTAALIVAAGSSARFGNDKLTTLIHGKPLISYTLQAFAETPMISSIILVISPERKKEFQELLDSLKNPQLAAITHLIAGGNTRHESVQRGMEALVTVQKKITADCFVAIHDGARPLITRTQIEQVCNAAYQHGAAALALPVIETLHRVNARGYAEKTIEREHLWSVQTPQVFRVADLIKLLPHVHPTLEKKLTDEVSLFREHGLNVTLIENHEPNLKVTYQADLRLVEAFLIQKIIPAA